MAAEHVRQFSARPFLRSDRGSSYVSIMLVSFCDNQARYARIHGSRILIRVDLIRYRSSGQIPSVIKQHAFYNCTRYPLDKSLVCAAESFQRLNYRSQRYVYRRRFRGLLRLSFGESIVHHTTFTVDERSIVATCAHCFNAPESPGICLKLSRSRNKKAR